MCESLDPASASLYVWSGAVDLVLDLCLLSVV